MGTINYNNEKKIEFQGLQMYCQKIMELCLLTRHNDNEKLAASELLTTSETFPLFA